MPPRPERVVLLRHGETEWSRAGRHTGRTDVDLTETGRRQAGAAGARLRGEHFALVLTSPMRRARDTCALAGFAGADVDADLAEWDYGEYEGRTAAEIREERPGWSPWTGGFPGGETVDQVGARADAVLERLRGEDGAVLLVAHGHLLRILAARWLGLGAAMGSLLTLSTASVSTLGWEREDRVVRLWNDVSHLGEVP